jgi:hypothetical protein
MLLFALYFSGPARFWALNRAGTDPAKGNILADFMKWMVSDGQGLSNALDYAPVTADVAAKANAALKFVM